MSKRLELKGIRFGRLFVLEFMYVEKQKTYWNCRCDCGNKKIICGNSLKNKAIKSCGCIRKENARQKAIDLNKEMNVWRNKEYTMCGKDNPNWNPDLTDEDRKNKRHIPGYDDWRKLVFERDNFTCQKCGSNKGGTLNAHHIESYSVNPDLRTTLSNGITLCKECHDDFHHQYGYGNNTIEQWEEFNGKRNMEK